MVNLDELRCVLAFLTKINAKIKKKKKKEKEKMKMLVLNLMLL